MDAEPRRSSPPSWEPAARPCPSADRSSARPRSLSPQRHRDHREKDNFKYITKLRNINLYSRMLYVVHDFTTSQGARGCIEDDGIKGFFSVISVFCGESLLIGCGSAALGSLCLCGDDFDSWREMRVIPRRTSRCLESVPIGPRAASLPSSSGRSPCCRDRRSPSRPTPRSLSTPGSSPSARRRRRFRR